MATKETTEPQLTVKEYFIERVKKYGCKNEDLAVNYFTAIEASIKKSETERAANQYKSNDPKIRWESVNLIETIDKVIAYSNLGIDPLAKEMISFIFHKNKSEGYTITFVEGVKCMEIIARRYGINCPENITVELVYSTDEFSLIKKDVSNPVDSYVLKVTNPFDRGDIVGGISLTEYSNTRYNKVREMSLKEINKRTKESTNFFKNWPKEMCEKTIAKNAWSKVVLDTTELADYYAMINNQAEDFTPENTEDLPFDPDAEL